MKKTCLLCGRALFVLAAMYAKPALPADYKVTPIALDQDDPDRTRVGRLSWRGGLVISSSDTRFGGLSGLLVGAKGARFLAVTDRGKWVTGSLSYRAGNLAGAHDIRIAPLRDPRGRRIAGKMSDSEGLARGGSGEVFVSFERRHRLLQYRGGPDQTPRKAKPLPAPADIRNLPNNGGIEALTRTCDGRLLAVAEKSLARAPAVKAWIQTAEGWRGLSYRTVAGLRPTGATTLPDCDIVFVERSFSIAAGLDIRIVRVPARAIHPDAVLQPEELARLSTPFTIDNFEGIAARRDGSGDTLLYIVSDDNFSSVQRTLLVMFKLEDAP